MTAKTKENIFCHQKLRIHPRPARMRADHPRQRGTQDVRVIKCFSEQPITSSIRFILWAYTL